MAAQDSGTAPKRPVPEFDSLNCDVFEVTEDMGTVDTTVRPMRDSLRIRMGLPPLGQPPENEPPKQNPT